MICHPLGIPHNKKIETNKKHALVDAAEETRRPSFLTARRGRADGFVFGWCGTNSITSTQLTLPLFHSDDFLPPFSMRPRAATSAVAVRIKISSDLVLAGTGCLGNLKGVLRVSSNPKQVDLVRLDKSNLVDFRVFRSDLQIGNLRSDLAVRLRKDQSHTRSSSASDDLQASSTMCPLSCAHLKLFVLIVVWQKGEVFINRSLFTSLPLKHIHYM